MCLRCSSDSYCVTEAGAWQIELLLLFITVLCSSCPENALQPGCIHWTQQLAGTAPACILHSNFCKDSQTNATPHMCHASTRLVAASNPSCQQPKLHRTQSVLMPPIHLLRAPIKPLLPHYISTMHATRSMSDAWLFNDVQCYWQQARHTRVDVCMTATDHINSCRPELLGLGAELPLPSGPFVLYHSCHSLLPRLLSHSRSCCISRSL